MASAAAGRVGAVRRTPSAPGRPTRQANPGRGPPAPAAFDLSRILGLTRPESAADDADADADERPPSSYPPRSAWPRREAFSGAGDAAEGADDVGDNAGAEAGRKALGASASAAAAENRPLKINRDLMLYRARVDQRRGDRSPSKTSAAAFAAAAEAKFVATLAMEPRDGRAVVGLARVYEKSGQTDRARRLLQEGCDAAAGENAHIWQAMATLESRCGAVGKARTLYDAALAADSGHCAAWHGWAMLEKRLGNAQRARDLLLRGLKAVPEERRQPHLYQSLAVMAADGQRFTEAREWFAAGAATALGAGSAPLWQSWGAMEARLGNVAAARALFQRGIQASPKNRYLWLAWAKWEAEQGHVARGRALYAQGHRLNPRDAALLQSWALLESAQGDAARARSLFRRAAAADASHQPVWQAWAIFEWRHGGEGGAARARELFQKGVWADPASPGVAAVFQAWGVLEGREGNAGVARSLFKCALKAAPANVPSWHAWAAMEDRLGDPSRAEELRALCLQQRAEESGSSLDLSPADMLAVDAPLMPVVAQIKDWVAKRTAAAQAARAAAGAATKRRPLPQMIGPAAARAEDAAEGGGAGGE